MVYKINKLDRVTTSTGKAKINATLMGEDNLEVVGVGIWADFPNFANLNEGDSVMGDIVVKDQWKTLYPPKTTTTGQIGGNKGGFIAKAQEKKAEYIERAQENKEEGIKISATMRDAVLCAIAEYNKDPHNLDTLEQLISKWRKVLWFEWDNHNTYPPFVK